MNPSPMVIHAPKPIRPAFTNSTKAGLHRRRSSASQTAAAAASASPSIAQPHANVNVPMSPEEATEELWSIFRNNVGSGPSSSTLSAAASWRTAGNRSRSCSRNAHYTQHAFQDRASPRAIATPPPRTALFNPVKFQPAFNFWTAAAAGASTHDFQAAEAEDAADSRLPASSSNPHSLGSMDAVSGQQHEQDDGSIQNI